MVNNTDIKYEKLPDGVDHWYRIKQTDEKPWFFRQLENIFDVLLSRPDKLPFGRSVAFLVGVSKYQYIKPNLPFVKNDIQDMRQFLLDKGGFDEVYVASEKIVNRTLIEDYMGNTFPDLLDQKDRLLFYYSGHGGDKGGKTGYMQFSEAQPSNFAGEQVLKINTIVDWCSETNISHLLFILDCCASGLAFTPKGVDTGINPLPDTLSGNGSRVVITAGTADEKTFEVPRAGGKGNGVFTRAFLNALEQGLADKGKDGFVTVAELYAEIQAQIASYAASHNQRITPQIWPLDVGDYRGTFVFFNPEAKNQSISLKDEYSNILAATSSSKGEVIATYGIIRLSSDVTGDVYIDDKPYDKIEFGIVKQYNGILTGNHKVEVKTNDQLFTENVEVTKGNIHNVTIRLEALTPSSQPVKQTTVSQQFRSTPKVFSTADVKAMLKQRNFYCKEFNWSKEYSNPNGHGFTNQFESKTIKHKKVVIDNTAGLMWQQSGSIHEINYKLANKWINKRNMTGYAGYNDWRLPTLEEAMNLMEPTKLNGALYIDPEFNAMQMRIWTADHLQGEWQGAWVVDFLNGVCHEYAFTNDPIAFVRAVRSGQSSAK